MDRRRGLAAVALAAVTGCSSGSTALPPLSHRQLFESAAPTAHLPSPSHHHRPNPSFDERMLAVDFADEEQGLLVHLACGRSSCRTAVDATADSGKTWRRVGTVPVMFQAYSFPTLVMSGPQTAVLSGTINHSDAGGVGFATFDGGRRWAKLPLPSNGSVAAVAGNKVWAISGHCGSRRQECASAVYASPLAPDRPFRLISRTPTRLPIEQLVANGTATLYASLSDTFREGATGPALLASMDDGRTWVRRQTPCGRWAQYLELSAPPGSVRTIWALCAGEAGTGMEQKSLAVSYDAGATWIDRPPPEGGGYSIGVVATSPTAAWRFASGRAPLFSTADGGSTWHITLANAIGDGGGGQEYWFDPLTSTLAWLVSAANIDHKKPFMLRTTDGGYTWQRLPLPF